MAKPVLIHLYSLNAEYMHRIEREFNIIYLCLLIIINYTTCFCTGETDPGGEHVEYQVLGKHLASYNHSELGLKILSWL